jgi:rRNA maturation RNase YbeY
MKIDLMNRQKLLTMNRRKAEALAQAFLTRPGPPVIAFARVTVVLTRDAEMRALKQAHFGEDVVTDVISLDYAPLPGEGAGDGVADVFINVEQACRVAALYQRRATRPDDAVARELALYLAHGIDHLRGGDDATPQGRASMRRRDLRWVRWAGRQGILAGWVTTPRGPL